jgi:hypothetical protein
MSTDEITDSVLKRHYEQHLAAGGAKVSSKLERSASADQTPQAQSPQTNNQGGHSSTVNTTSNTTSSAPAAQVTPTAQPAEAKSSIWKILIPVIGLALLGFIGMKFLGGGDDAAKLETGDMAVPDVSAVGEELTGVFSSATSALEGITDADSATAAVPGLTDAASKLEGVSEQFSQIPEAARGPIAAIVGDNMSKLQGLVDKLTQLPGVGDILKPVIEPIMKTLGGLAG